MIARGRLSRLLLAVAGFGVLVLGLVTLMEPRVLEPMGFRFDTVLARNEVPKIRDAALMILATISFGLIAGRAASLVADGWPGLPVVVFMAVEGLAAALAVGLLVARRSP